VKTVNHGVPHRIVLFSAGSYKDRDRRKHRETTKWKQRWQRPRAKMEMKIQKIDELRRLVRECITCNERQFGREQYEEEELQQPLGNKSGRLRALTNFVCHRPVDHLQYNCVTVAGISHLAGWTAGTRFPTVVTNFSAHHLVHTDSGVYRSSWSTWTILSDSIYLWTSIRTTIFVQVSRCSLAQRSPTVCV
jgi:hypothetical protein